MSAFDDLVMILREECGNQTADRVAQRLQKTFGTQRIYVPGKPVPDIQCTDTVKTLRARHNCSRATAYNWMNRYKL